MKYVTCQIFAIYGIYVQDQKYKFCKKVKNCSKKCTKQRIYDACLFWKKRYQCITKRYYNQYKEINIQKSYFEWDKIFFKCSSEGKNFNP